MRNYKTEGLVLRQTNLGESDRILVFYTAEFGKVRAVAKGIRKPKSKLAGHLELLNQVQLSLTLGKHFDFVNEAQVLSGFKGLRENLDLLSQALYVAELSDGLTPDNEPNHAIYNLIEDTLTWFATGKHSDLLLRHFELRLLVESGYGPELYSCIECRRDLKPTNHLFSCIGGGAICSECKSLATDKLIPLPLTAMKVLRFILREGTYEQIAQVKVSPDQLRAIERITTSYVVFTIERELKSANFMKRIKLESTRRQRMETFS